MQTLAAVVRYVFQMVVILLILAGVSALYLTERAIALIARSVRLIRGKIGR